MRLLLALACGVACIEAATPEKTARDNVLLEVGTGTRYGQDLDYYPYTEQSTSMCGGTLVARWNPNAYTCNSGTTDGTVPI